MSAGVHVGLALLGVALGGCFPARPAALNVWASERMRVEAAPAAGEARAGLYDASRGQVTLAGAINETLDFRIFVQNSGGGGAIKAACDGLRSADGAIEPAAVQLFRMESVHVGRWPGWHIRSVDPAARVADVPDVLVPLGAEGRVAVAAGATLSLWVDLSIPKGTPPGDYSGEITIGDGREIARTIDVRLTVWPLVLPDATPVVLAADVNHAALFRYHVRAAGASWAVTQTWGDHAAAAELDQALADAMQLLAAHRVTGVLDRLRPIIKVGRDADVSVEWEEYDRVVADYLNGRRFEDRVPPPVWCIPFDEYYPPPPPYGAGQSPLHSRVVRGYLKACAEHFAEKGWLERSFVALPGRTGDDRKEREMTRHFARISRLADSRLVTLVELPPQDVSDYGWDGYVHEDLSSVVDVWCAPAQFYDPALMDAQRQRGKRTWLRIGQPPFSASLHIAGAGVDARAVAWQARRARAAVVRLGTANDWPEADPSGVTAQACIEHDPAVLLYPGTPYGLHAPVASARLKQLRRGMQDVAYLTLLDAAGLAHISEVLAESLCPRVGTESYRNHYADAVSGAWIDDDLRWADARQIAVDELARSGGRAQLAAQVGGDISGSVHWRRFITATRHLSLTTDGVRVRRPGGRAQGAALIEAAVSLRNDLRAAVGGQLRFETLPLGWQADPLVVELGGVAPGRTVGATLAARAPVMTWDPGGVRRLAALFRGDDGRMLRFPVRVNYLACAALATPLTIDGDLSDWPAAPGNLADDFALIARAGWSDSPPSVAVTTSVGRPTHRTQCLVGRDATCVYFGFHCWTGGETQDAESARNFVHYEDLVPVGEELVEIVIDPTNGGSRYPSDLYHLVIKRSGASSWERGVALEPPVGQRQVWAADVRVQVRSRTEHWTAEVAIPLAAFGEGAGGAQVWGINFARFDAQAQEYSNWAAAAGNVYDPMSLGNLDLP